MNVSVAIVQKDAEVLVVLRQLREDALGWSFPSGKVEPEETTAGAAIRETFEETGVRCEAIRRLGERVHPNTAVHVTYWLCRYQHGDARVINREEIAEVQWVSGTEAIGHFTSDIFPPVREFLSKLATSGVT